MSETPPASSQFVQSLARGLAVIRAFDAENIEMTLSDVARRTELSRATARRFLFTLAELGYVRTDGRYFSLTPMTLQLGYSYLSGLSLPQIAEPHLEALSQELHESTSASMLDGTEIVYVARVPTRRIMTVAITVGTRFPAYATSMGRVLLAALPPEQLQKYFATAELLPLTSLTKVTREDLSAELDRVREQGWALVDQELEPGLRSMAAPVRDADGTVVAAVNVSMQAPITAASGAADPVNSVLPQLLAAAQSISADISVAAPGSRRK